MVVDVPVIGGEKTHGSNLRGSSLSVLETIAPSETVPAPITEDDDPHVRHWGWWAGMHERSKTPFERAFFTLDTSTGGPGRWMGRRPGNPIWTLCGKRVYELPRANSKWCQACTDLAKESNERFLQMLESLPILKHQPT